jgi:hypothetical protein
MKEFRIGFGSEFDRDQSCIPIRGLDRRLDRIRAHALTQFGGYAESRVTGGWINGKGKVVIEGGKQLAIIADNAKLVREFAAYVCIKLNQESVVFILPDGDVEFVSAEPADQWDGSDIGESKPIYGGHG